MERCKHIGAVQSVPPYTLPGEDLERIRNRAVAIGADTVLLDTMRAGPATVGLAVFWAMPVAPPRMLTTHGYVDLVAVAHHVPAWRGGSVALDANQLCALPSLHLAWSDPVAPARVHFQYWGAGPTDRNPVCRDAPLASPRDIRSVVPERTLTVDGCNLRSHRAYPAESVRRSIDCRRWRGW